MLINEISKKVILKKILYIYYLIWFKKDKIKALIDSNNKTNIIIPANKIKLGLKICHINVETYKIKIFIFAIF